jgi:hypothetical protein
MTGRRQQRGAFDHVQPVIFEGGRIAAMIAEEDRVETLAAEG